MSFEFVEKVMCIGGNNETTPQFQFYRRGFKLGGSGSPSWQDIVLSGNGSLTLTQAKADGLNYLKLFGGTDTFAAGSGVTVPTPETPMDIMSNNGTLKVRNKSGLPLGYQRIEYLESTGTQYIDTGIVLKSEATIETVTELTQINWSAGPYSFWGFMAAGTMPRWGWSVYQNRWLPDLNSTTQVYSPVVDRNKHTFTNTCYYNQGGNLVYDSIVDGVSVYEGARRVDSTEYYTSNTLSAYIFARNNANVAGNFIGAKIYSYKIIQDGILVLDLIPCRRNSDNVLGMYDLVSGNFLTNQGTGDFTAGDDVDDLEIYVDGTAETSYNLMDKNACTDGYYYTENGTYTESSDIRLTDYIPVKANQAYTIKVKNKSVSYRLNIRINIFSTDKTWTSQTLKEAQINLSDFQYFQFTPTIDGYIRVSAAVTQGGSASCDFDTFMLVEGAYDSSTMPPYQSYYNIAGVEQIEIHGKNYLNESDYKSYVIGSNKGDVYPSPDRYSLFVEISKTNLKAGDKITLSRSEVGTSTFWRVGFYSSSPGNHVYPIEFYKSTESAIDDYTWTLTIPEKTKYIVVCYGAGTSVNNQLELGETKTAYEPYYYGGSATAEMLLKVGDYKDEQNVTSGAITRNVGIKVLDGSESWSYYSVQQGNLFRTKITDGLEGAKDALGVLCNYYNTVASSSRAEGTLTGASQNYDFINNNYSNLTDWQQYLKDLYAAGQPIIIVYPLQTPTTETVTAQPMNIQAGTNIVKITQASIDNLGLEVSFKGKI